MSYGGFVKSLAILGTFAGLSVCPAPAFALDDGKGNSLLDALDFIGLGTKPDDPVILYRERPPLVLPPKTELVKPLPPASERTANWPTDPEVARAAKLADENRIRVGAEDDELTAAGRLARTGRIKAADSRDNARGQKCSMADDSPNHCSPAEYWRNLAVKSNAPASKEIQAGVEPDRQYLTQPPKGYLAPKKTVAATFEKPRTPDGEDPFGQMHPEVLK